MEPIEPDLGLAGVQFASPRPPLRQGEDYWATFAETVELSLATLEQPRP